MTQFLSPTFTEIPAIALPSTALTACPRGAEPSAEEGADGEEPAHAAPRRAAADTRTAVRSFIPARAASGVLRADDGCDVKFDACSRGDYECGGARAPL
jgi:hypothetical protein